MHFFLSVSLAVALSLAGACGGEDSSGDGSGGSGVERNKSLGQITAAEAQALCRFEERMYKNSLGSEDAYCVAEGASGASTLQECVEWRQDCIDFGSYNDDRDEDWECGSATPDDFDDFFSVYGGNCNSVVGHFEDCIYARVRNREMFNESGSCDDPSSFELLEDPPQCASFARCE